MPPPLVGAFSMWYDTPMTFPEIPNRDPAPDVHSIAPEDMYGDIERGDIIRTPRGVAEVIEVRPELAMVKLSDRPDHVAFYGIVRRGTAFWGELVTGELIDSM